MTTGAQPEGVPYTTSLPHQPFLSKLKNAVSKTEQQLARFHELTEKTTITDVEFSLLFLNLCDGYVTNGKECRTVATNLAEVGRSIELFTRESDEQILSNELSETYLYLSSDRTHFFANTVAELANRIVALVETINVLLRRSHPLQESI